MHLGRETPSILLRINSKQPLRQVRNSITGSLIDLEECDKFVRQSITLFTSL